MKAYYIKLDTPLGKLCMRANEQGVTNLYLFEEEWQSIIEEEKVMKEPNKWCEQGAKELAAYFEGRCKHFNVPLDIGGTPFRKKVWRALEAIPYGEVVTYKEIGKRIGNEKAARAIGNANRANPVPIVIPCHRVIGCNGKLTGYAGTHINLKKILLEIERNHS